MIDTSAENFWSQLFETLATATGETLYQVLITGFITLILGTLIGTLVIITAKGGILEAPFRRRSLGHAINSILQLVVNLGRSVPFIILMVALIPFTRFLLGSAFGVSAAIVPLTIAAVPFFARLVEISLREVPQGLVEAGNSLGATNRTIVWKILLAEATPGLILGFTTTVISIVNYSAIVGVIGGGGLGDVAIRYGYQRYSVVHMVAVIVLLVILVAIVQVAGSSLARRLSHR